MRGKGRREKAEVSNKGTWHGVFVELDPPLVPGILSRADLRRSSGLVDGKWYTRQAGNGKAGQTEYEETEKDGEKEKVHHS